MSAHVSRSEKNYSMCYMKWFLFVANLTTFPTSKLIVSFYIFSLVEIYIYVLKYMGNIAHCTRYTV
jgi:hypothetical protein